MEIKSNRYMKNAEQPKVVAGGHKPEPKPVVEEPKVETPVVEEKPVEKPVAAEAKTVDKDFLAQFVEPKPKRKTYSIYLSDEASKKLDKLAKQLKCNRSKAMEILLIKTVE